MTLDKVRIAFLHLAPVVGALERNRRLLELGIRRAAQRGTDWVLTPELAVCGYQFAQLIGTDWIMPQPDPWMMQFCELVRCLGIAVFLSHPEREVSTGKLYNSLFVIGRHGGVIGTHRKLSLIAGPESWATPGETVSPVIVDGIRVGMLICADVYAPGPAMRLKDQGAEMLISAAAWGPGDWEPNGEWEARSQETGLPLLVCNRTGLDATRSFDGAESVIAKGGARVLSFQAPRSTLFLVDWDLGSQAPFGADCQAEALMTSPD